MRRDNREGVREGRKPLTKTGKSRETERVRERYRESKMAQEGPKMAQGGRRKASTWFPGLPKMALSLRRRANFAKFAFPARSTPKDDTRWVEDGPRWLEVAAKRTHDGPKMAPSWPKMAPR